jgi:hypothetical protein
MEYDLPCPICHARFAMPDLPCPICHARFAMPDLPCPICHARFAMPETPNITPEYVAELKRQMTEMEARNTHLEAHI